ncbi:hypothetical protein [Cobetia sp. 1AS1]|uniref:hypothetical protein n=1 Tax=Cobetia sp. 1AS1 TaxID=3040016 RepID=UPI00244C9E9F|nr:hypothetical protein [Cobetia sp. 1AS1]MDH2296048.1 hypothetical protein [Cobetia sp. 1AS1]
MNMHIGSISQGTLRPQDLIPTFLDALAKYDSAAHEQLVAQPHPPIPAYVQDEGDDSEWWDSEEAAFLQEELINALENAAPDGTYFGTHEGDGADFGFWSLGQWRVITEDDQVLSTHDTQTEAEHALAVALDDEHDAYLQAPGDY